MPERCTYMTVIFRSFQKQDYVIVRTGMEFAIHQSDPSERPIRAIIHQSDSSEPPIRAIITEHRYGIRTIRTVIRVTHQSRD